MSSSPLEHALVEQSQSLARELLDIPEFRGTRWRHVQAVGAKAANVAPALGTDGAYLIAAAWLHDIGYAARLIHSGFHPLDGADHLVLMGFPDRVASLVAHHSGAAQEAPLRGLAVGLGRYVDAADAVRDALWACDMTTSPTGEPVEFDERLREIKERYGQDHTVPLAIESASDEIRACIRRTRQRARAAGIEVGF